MKFLMGDILGFGVVGMIYYSTGGYLISRIIFFLVAALTLIGIFTVIKWIFTRRKKKKMTPGEKWLKTGKFD